MVTPYLTRTDIVRVESRTPVVRVEERVMKIVVVGGTGHIGRKLIKLLTADGHEAVAASRSTGVDAVTGEGLAAALTGASVVVDVSNAPVWGDAEVRNFFETSTRNLVEAGRAAGV